MDDKAKYSGREFREPGSGRWREEGQWKECDVSDCGDTFTLEVEGGWLFRVREGRWEGDVWTITHMAVVFVPNRT